MLIRSIEMSGFVGAQDTRSLLLPTRGIVIITGANGAGKSSFIEAVSFVLWGKLLRGTKPWRTTGPNTVHVITDTVTVERKPRALAWNENKQSPIVWESNTIAQDALTDIVGVYDLWRRTHVLTSTDAAHFSTATDRERKQLLETIIGLDKFDAAHAKCKLDLVNATRGEQVAVSARNTLHVRIASAEKEISNAQAVVESCVPSDPSQVEELTLACASTKAEMEEIKGGMRTIEQEVRRMRTEFSELQFRLAAQKEKAALISRGVCPTCTTPFSHEFCGDVASAVRAAQEALEHRGAELRKAIEAREACIAGSADYLADVSATHAQMSAKLQAIEHQSRALRVAQEQAQQALQSKEKLLVELSSTECEWDELKARVGMLNCAEKVLGMRGVRASMLGDALGAIEQVANVWLGRIASADMSLRLKPYTENADGTARECIDLEVEGVGGGHGYYAASSGERRRIDIALLLALSEIGRGNGGSHTLWFDEVFDALDSTGRTLVGESLAGLAQDHCVVLITHSEEMVEALPDGAVVDWVRL